MANNNVNPSGYKFNIPPVNSDPFWDNSGGGDVPDITASATVDSEVGTPSVDVVKSGVDPINFAFSFHNLKGEPGTNGTDGQDGADGTTPAISITGTINTTAPASPSVTVTKTGTDEAPNFNFAFGGLNALQGKVPSGEYNPETGEPIYNDSPIITNNILQSMEDLIDPTFDGKEGALVPSVKYVNLELSATQNSLWGVDNMDNRRKLNSASPFTRDLVQSVSGYQSDFDGMQIPSMRALMEVAGSSGGGAAVKKYGAGFPKSIFNMLDDFCNSSGVNWSMAYIPATYSKQVGSPITLVYYQYNDDFEGHGLLLSSSARLTTGPHVDIPTFFILSGIDSGYILMKKDNDIYILGRALVPMDAYGVLLPYESSDILSKYPQFIKLDPTNAESQKVLIKPEFRSNYYINALLRATSSPGSNVVYDQLHFYDYDTQAGTYTPVDPSITLNEFNMEGMYCNGYVYYI